MDCLSNEQNKVMKTETSLLLNPVRVLLTVNFTEYQVEGTDDSDHVRNVVVASHEVSTAK